MTDATTHAKIQEEIQKLEPSAIIELFQLEFTEALNNSDGDTTYYYHAGTNGLKADIKFANITYAATPIVMKGFEMQTKGTLPRPKMTLSNANSGISALLISGGKDGGRINPLKAKLTRIRTCAKFLDEENFPNDHNPTKDPDAKFADDVFYIDRVSVENPTIVEFEMSSRLNMINLQIPGRRITEFCPWKYRGTECRYTGNKFFDSQGNSVTDRADDVCGKRYSDCTKRFGTKSVLPFGGFPASRLQL